MTLRQQLTAIALWVGVAALFLFTRAVVVSLRPLDAEWRSTTACWVASPAMFECMELAEWLPIIALAAAAVYATYVSQPERVRRVFRTDRTTMKLARCAPLLIFALILGITLAASLLATQPTILRRNKVFALSSGRRNKRNKVHIDQQLQGGLLLQRYECRHQLEHARNGHIATLGEFDLGVLQSMSDSELVEVLEKHTPQWRHQASIAKELLDEYFTALGCALADAVVQNKSRTLSPHERSHLRLRADIPVAPGLGHTWHQPLSLEYYDEVMSMLGDVIFVGDSTIRIDSYEMVAALNERKYPVKDYSVLDAVLYKKGIDISKLTQGAMHGNLIHRPRAGKSGQQIAYYGYYWAAVNPDQMWREIWKLAATSRLKFNGSAVVIYNVGLHALYDHTRGFQNETLLANLENHFLGICQQAAARHITLILASTNPICSARYTGPKAEYTKEARDRTNVFMERLKRARKMGHVRENASSPGDGPVLPLSENARLNIHSAEGPIALNERMRAAANHFRRSPYVWYWDRHAVLEQSKCAMTPQSDGRHYARASFVTVASLLNMLHEISAIQGKSLLLGTISEEPTSAATPDVNL